MVNLTDPKYNDVTKWIDNAINKGKSWEDIIYACKKNENGLKVFLQSKIDNDFWDDIEVDEWIDAVKTYKRISNESASVTMPNEIVEGHDNYIEPQVSQSAWQLYKNYLFNKKHFSYRAVNNIKKSCLDILNRLSADTSNKTPIKGLVMGNVQSGKTANMAGLISMAADYGWNMFIILTGTIENLRLQTQKRFQYDLQDGNIMWYHIDHPGKDNTFKMDRLSVEKQSKSKYITCCLKTVSRLKDLYKWLNSDTLKKQQLRILVIDDEADQASLNTKSNDERTAINRLILSIVNNLSNGRNKYGDIPYLSMNYVGYTATPYGNFLNESKKESLFPKDFISILSTPDIYFGPQQIFGDPFSSAWEGMPIINKISSEDDDEIIYKGDISDTERLDEIAENGYGELPNSLKRAIGWLCDCVAIQRYKKSVSPVSMLLHHTHKIVQHTNIATAISHWYKSLSKEEFISVCKEAYNEQTEMMSKEIFDDVCSEYGMDEGIDHKKDIEDYPLFKDIKKELMAMYKKMKHISINSEGDISFHNGIHLCVDNSASQAVTDTEQDEEYAHVRLLYPTNENPYDGYAPAFLIVGGNTLSRGLTLEGLVCTYFSRKVGLGDSLMQMGRWFGYRRGYELLPRLWMTERTQKQYDFLTELDSDLRLNLFKYQSELTPLECAPMILNTPGVSFLRITAANKMQNSTPAEMNFAGVNMQTTNFKNDQSLITNLEVTEKFLNGLSSSKGKYKELDNIKIWYKIPFEKIWDELLSKGEFNLVKGTDIAMFKDWITDLTNKGKLEEWNVVLRGKQTNLKHPENFWMGVGKVTRSRKITGMHSADSKEFNIGVLTDPNDWKVDLPDGFMISSEDIEILDSVDKGNKAKASKEQVKNRIREENGFGKVPMLVIYCIDKRSTTQKKGRAPLNVDNDVVGISIRVPGDRINDTMCSRITIKIDKDMIDNED